MEEERCDNEKILFNTRKDIEEKLHNTYVWHIITLAKMKYKLKELKGVN